MYKTIITPRSFCCLAILCCLALPALADDVELRQNHPDRHVVVKGDTLWGISGKFLKDPWQWPKVWKLNRAEIKNPHRIYPGDVIALDMSSGSPQLRLIRETVMLEPTVREEALAKTAVPTISLAVISPFLSQPLVIENNALDDAATIIGGQENRVVLSPGVKIYVDKIEEGTSTAWQVYRNGKVLVDPATKEVLGTEAIYLGDADITNYGEPATAEIIRAKEEIFKGDKLVAAPEETTASFIPHAPDDQITGNIISIYAHVGIGESSTNSIVTIDRGSDDGLEDGHVLAIYQKGGVVRDPKAASNHNKLKELNVKTKRREDGQWEINFPKEDPSKAPPGFIKLPNERVGLLMIFRTFARVSYGLIMQATEPVSVLDSVQTP